MKNIFKNRLIGIKTYILTFFKWALIAALTGALCGVIGAFFHMLISYVTSLRVQNPFILYLMPVGGVIIVLLYKLCKTPITYGTNKIFCGVNDTEQKIPLRIAPLIFVSTVITHLVGGSAGREGAALQVGGSVGFNLGKLLCLSEKDMPIIILCGMSAVFSAMFVTPVTAAFFVIEVTCIGAMYYSAFVPCMIASLTGYGMAILLKIPPIHFPTFNLPSFSVVILLKVAAIAAVCAVLSIFFIYVLRRADHIAEKYIKNDFLRVILGSVLLILLSLIFRSGDYNGGGMEIVERALAGDALPYAFILKILFTAITLSVGFKGGEIVPTIFIGATLGCVLGNLLGIGGGFGAAVGIIAFFCSAVNCPVASMVLSIEFFGAGGFIYFTLACAIGYMLSGYCGLYKSQKIVYSKLNFDTVNRLAG